MNNNLEATVDNINYLNKSIIFNDESKDFVSETLNEEELERLEILKKRKLTLLGLSSIYIFLILASFTFLT